MYSIASGLVYPSVGPQHCYLKDIGRVKYTSITDKECLDKFMVLSRVEENIPTLESAHALVRALISLVEETRMLISLPNTCPCS